MKARKINLITQNAINKYKERKSLKQAISTLLVAMLLLGLSGCGTKVPGDEIKSNPETDLAESSIANINGSINLSDYEALTKEYLAPLALSSITVTTWNNANEILPHRFGLFYVAKKSSADSSNSTNWDTTSVDAEEVESLIKNYFDISLEYLRSSDYYDVDSSSYTFESLGGAASFKVVDAKLNAQKLLLGYEYYSPADGVTVIREGVLTIMLGEHSYKYVSCSTD